MGEWGACDKCGGQRKRTRQIFKMAEDGGNPCTPGASEETEKCKRQCHAPVFCAWSAWEEDGGCSVTCGTGTVKRVRYLQARAQASTLVEIDSNVKAALGQCRICWSGSSMSSSASYLFRQQ